ncbi:hypothetical protein HELRODRAFT_180033 [Helobdella robusta]|uniref:Uncharacterized protein n=1 Tax=Helobdella robusta TaxID=6412 RepID=T1FFD4_HELRO|nr:hypothetical protein HELRODRAFT_180033 [Helobdella robusta]ESN94926.1 hypothetical protein HELRODRAFT_180033 [Helobdella robusta]
MKAFVFIFCVKCILVSSGNVRNIYLELAQPLILFDNFEGSVRFESSPSNLFKGDLVENGTLNRMMQSCGCQSKFLQIYKKIMLNLALSLQKFSLWGISAPKLSCLLLRLLNDNLRKGGIKNGVQKIALEFSSFTSTLPYLKIENQNGTSTVSNMDCMESPPSCQPLDAGTLECWKGLPPPSTCVYVIQTNECSTLEAHMGIDEAEDNVSGKLSCALTDVSNDQRFKTTRIETATEEVKAMKSDSNTEAVFTSTGAIAVTMSIILLSSLTAIVGGLIVSCKYEKDLQERIQMDAMEGLPMTSDEQKYDSIS